MKQSNSFQLNQQKIDLLFLLATIVLVVAQFSALFSLPSRPLTYLWYAMTVILLIVGYWKGRIVGLLMSLVGVFLYGSYNIYEYFILHLAPQLSLFDILWFFVFPLNGFMGGILGDTIHGFIHHYQTVYGQLDELLLTDPMTGLSTNKRFFFDLQEELERAKRHFIRRKRADDLEGEWEQHSPDTLVVNEIVTVLLFEILYFREFTLLYGEQQANQLLVTIADSMQSSSRLSDRKAKLDPAKFAIILPETSAPNAEIVKERLKETIYTYQMTLSKSRTKQVKLNLRFGIVTGPFQGNTPEELYEAAERELQYGLG